MCWLSRTAKRRVVLFCFVFSFSVALLSVSCEVANQMPIIQSVSSDKDWVYPGDNVSIDCQAYDPDGDTISYQWSANGGTIAGNGSSAIWTAPSGSGIYTATVIVRDVRGGYVTSSLFINVRANQPPTIDDLSAETNLVRFGDKVAIGCTASDPDGDAISYQWSTNGGTLSGEGSSVIWRAPDTTGSYTITVLVKDTRGGEATSSLVIGVRLNDPPTIDKLTAEANSVGLGGSVNLECLASDPDGDDISYEWSADCGTISGDGPIATWTAPETDGDCTITVTVTDSRDATASADVTIDVLPNSPPVINNLKAEQTTVLTGKSTVIKCDASDPDGDVLTYTWEATGGELSGKGAEITWTASGNCGDQVVVTVTVSDGAGGEASRKVTLTVKKPG
jgi:hypothetical protein